MLQKIITIIVIYGAIGIIAIVDAFFKSKKEKKENNKKKDK